AFGGSFLNHFMLVCACAPYYPDAENSPAKGQISVVEADGVTLKVAPDSPKSALEKGPKFVNDGSLSPDFYAINTMQPPYQPSAVAPASGGDKRFADVNAKSGNVVGPETMPTIGDLLIAKGVKWAWYAGAWKWTLDGRDSYPLPNFQFHHHPFNYFVNYAPGTPARDEHLRDGGLWGLEFLKD